MKLRISAFLLFTIAGSLFSESLSVINRTGNDIEIIQSAPAGSDQWGGDLIPGTILPDSDSIILDLIGDSPWAFRMLDTDGVVYVLYNVEPGMTGKITVGPENQAQLAVFAGSQRSINLTNHTGATISSLKISSVSDGAWGSDVLAGRYIRDGESVNFTIDAIPGTLSFDLLFTLAGSEQDIRYEKQDIILTDGTSIILSLQ